MATILGLEIDRIAHAAVRVAGSKVVYVDPIDVPEGAPGADLVLLTHAHEGHLSLTDLARVCARGTEIVAFAGCAKRLGRVRHRPIQPGEKIEAAGIEVEAVQAYNESGRPHAKGDGVGFVFRVDGVRVYHAGDTDPISEMFRVQCRIAFLPVSGTTVMDAQAAAEAAGRLRPEVAIPIHYGARAGSAADAEEFASLARCRVEILPDAPVSNRPRRRRKA